MCKRASEAAMIDYRPIKEIVFCLLGKAESPETLIHWDLRVNEPLLFTRFFTSYIHSMIVTDMLGKLGYMIWLWTLT